jgi:hypothetical protein
MWGSTGKQGKQANITSIECAEERWGETKIKGISNKFSKKHSKKLTPTLTSFFCETL